MSRQILNAITQSTTVFRGCRQTVEPSAKLALPQSQREKRSQGRKEESQLPIKTTAAAGRDPLPILHSGPLVQHGVPTAALAVQGPTCRMRDPCPMRRPSSLLLAQHYMVVQVAHGALSLGATVVLHDGVALGLPGPQLHRDGAAEVGAVTLQRVEACRGRAGQCCSQRRPQHVYSSAQSVTSAACL
jgi:hypothetical protein